MTQDIPTLIQGDKVVFNLLSPLNLRWEDPSWIPPYESGLENSRREFYMRYKEDTLRVGEVNGSLVTLIIPGTNSPFEVQFATERFSKVAPLQIQIPLFV